MHIDSVPADVLVVGLTATVEISVRKARREPLFKWRNHLAFVCPPNAPQGASDVIAGDQSVKPTRHLSICGFLEATLLTRNKANI